MSSLKKIRKRRRKEAKKVEEVTNMIQIINSMKSVSMLVLRNEGWGETRLKRFGDNFDTVLHDISQKRLSVNDIPGVLEEETGLTIDDISVKKV